MIKSNWWEEKEGFFGEFYKEGDDSTEGAYYDRKLNREERTREEISGVIRLCKLKKNSKVLDCPCGWGRHSIELSKNGIIMTGGTSQLRNLADLVYRRTGVKARVAEEPFLCVAKGTGEALNHLDTYKKSIISKR